MKRASSATFNAQSTATGHGWDPDMRRNARMAPLIARSRKCGEKTLAAGEQHAAKTNVHLLHRRVWLTIDTVQNTRSLIHE